MKNNYKLLKTCQHFTKWYEFQQSELEKKHENLGSELGLSQIGDLNKSIFDDNCQITDENVSSCISQRKWLVD